MSELSGIKDGDIKRIDRMVAAWSIYRDNTIFSGNDAYSEYPRINAGGCTGIETALTQVVHEVLPKPDAFAGRNLKRLSV